MGCATCLFDKLSGERKAKYHFYLAQGCSVTKKAAGMGAPLTLAPMPLVWCTLARSHPDAWPALPGKSQTASGKPLAVCFITGYRGINF
jgi:hypothetical protein